MKKEEGFKEKLRDAKCVSITEMHFISFIYQRCTAGVKSELSSLDVNSPENKESVTKTPLEERHEQRSQTVSGWQVSLKSILRLLTLPICSFTGPQH